MFNEHQREYMNYLATVPPERLCWCGWYDLGKCYNCNQAHPGRTRADYLAAVCPSCKGSRGAWAGEMGKSAWVKCEACHETGWRVKVGS